MGGEGARKLYRHVFVMTSPNPTIFFSSSLFFFIFIFFFFFFFFFFFLLTISNRFLCCSLYLFVRRWFHRRLLFCHVFTSSPSRQTTFVQRRINVDATSQRCVPAGLFFVGVSGRLCFIDCITKTCLYNVDPHKSHFYIVKLGFTGVCIIFLISAQKHRFRVLLRTHSLCFEQQYKKISAFYIWKFSFCFGGKMFSIFEWACFRMMYFLGIFAYSFCCI